MSRYYSVLVTTVVVINGLHCSKQGQCYLLLLVFNLSFEHFQTKVTKGSGRRQQGKSKRKTTLRFSVDCKHPVEDGIMDVANFVSSHALCH